MKRQTIIAAVLIAWLSASTAHALTVAYGQRDIAKAGPGCVGGYISGHGNTAYFRGNTETLNRQLALLSRRSEYGSVKVVLHAGEKMVDSPGEEPLTGFADENRKELAINWSVRGTCPTDDVLTGRCECDRRIATVDIWIANEIRLDDLIVPKEFVVQSAAPVAIRLEDLRR